jgi:glyoxylase-like metal-dependent hydrolase (beta-lactamase superfamily II)
LTGTPETNTAAMCPSGLSPETRSPTSRPSYFSSELNATTHLVIHKDKYFEFPFVYVKLYPQLSLAVIIDTGCGAHNGQDDGPGLELKDYIHGDILSSEQASFDFLVICTHCHFDHIGGIEAFAKSGASIIASGHNRDFLRPDRRGKNSLCDNFGTKTPKYEVSHYTQDGEELEHNGHGLGLQIIHTPGHTPDSIAIYDEAERWLYVGDTCYQRFATMPWGEEQNVPIILPLQGHWKDFIVSLYTLHEFVKQTEESVEERGMGKRIQLAAGHTTSQSPAADFLHRVIGFCEGIVTGTVPEFVRIPGDVVAPGGSLGDEMFILWQDKGRTEFSLMAPESFKNDFWSSGSRKDR